ncbi:hypothetical protein HMPREF0541_00825 [Lacticaseibacillus rhamnosus ATCC 21052]|nr:hypothetical protein HMPREF0541_00825 [Lacticaseibacillus rhamnosus ATCC 21052]
MSASQPKSRIPATETAYNTTYKKRQPRLNSKCVCRPNRSSVSALKPVT